MLILKTIAEYHEICQSTVVRDPRKKETLQSKEIQEITNKSWLAIQHLNAAMGLLREQFPDIGALFNLQYCESGSFPTPESPKWMQIIHNGAAHWLAVAKGFVDQESVMVFDSIGFDRGNELVKETIASLAHCQKDRLSVSIMHCQKQSNSYDCGVFVVAYLTSLAHGQNPVSVLYDKKKIRNHLKECLLAGRLELFPTISQKNTTSLRCLMYNYPIFCTCRRTNYRY